MKEREKDEFKSELQCKVEKEEKKGDSRCIDKSILKIFICLNKISFVSIR